MFVLAYNYGMRDYAVSRAIMELHETHEFITHQMIADHIRATRNTVGESVRYMRRAGLLMIVRGGNHCGGYHYQYVGD